MPNPTERFSNRVENYVKYRPGYPKEILEIFREEMDLKPSSLMADIGSGTGISTKIFLENGNQVFGIEPNQAMREASEIFLKDFPRFRAIDGTAEKTGLADKSVDFIISAQAFHWFDKAKTPDEFRRILRENGYLVLIWNERQLDSTEFLQEYERFILKFGTDYQKVRHENVTKKSIEDIFQIEFQEAIFQNTQIFDFSGLKGRILSSSYMPTEESENFHLMIKELNLLFTKYQKNDTIELLYHTKIFYGKL